MAESLRRIERRDRVTDDDPLYELTRIMGLEPAREAQSYPDFDIEIDLEKELLGEWREPALPLSAAAPIPLAGSAPEPVVLEAEAEPAAEFDPLDDFIADMETELAEGFADPEPEPAALVEPDREPEMMLVPAVVADEPGFSEWPDEIEPHLAASEPEEYAAPEATTVELEKAWTAPEGPAEAWGDELALPELVFDELTDEPLASEHRADDLDEIVAAAFGLDDEAGAGDLLVGDAVPDSVIHALPEPVSLEAEPGEQDPFGDFEIVDEGWAADESADIPANDAGIAAIEAHLPPEIDTIEVPVASVAVADDLGIPEFAFEPEPAVVQDYDDLESEFAYAFGELRDTPAAPAAVESWNSVPPEIVDSAAEEWQSWTAPVAAALGSAASQGATLSRSASQTGAHQTHETFDVADFEDEIERSVAAELAARAPEPDFDDDEALAREIAMPGPAISQRTHAPFRRGLVVAALVAGVAVAGGAAAYALSGKDGVSGPVLVKADPGPMKVKPENPGGFDIPNQDNKVYDRVSGGSAAAPTQQTLITTAEEPVDIDPPAPAPMPADTAAMAPTDATSTPVDLAAAGPADDRTGRLMDDDSPAQPLPPADEAAAAPVKNEQRVTVGDTSDNAPNLTAVMPARRVKTMVVRPDGTLAPREDPAPAAETASASTEASADQSAAGNMLAGDLGVSVQPLAPASDQTGAVPVPDAAPATASANPAPEALSDREPAPAEDDRQADSAATPASERRDPVTPQAGPIAPPRPSDQPVDIVGEVKSSQVASAASEASPTLVPEVSTAGKWAMQIASQPTEELAQASYRNMVKRYGSVIGGKPASIVKAELAGRGTVWRVRVAADSKSDAQALCIQYRAAGGSCFVSK